MDKAKKNPWKQISTKVVHKNPWFYVTEDGVIKPNGEKGQYNVVVSPGAAFIVALNEKNEVYLIGQYRYPTSSYSLELPAGSIDKQQPLAAAKRELKEETGLEAKNWKKLGSFQTANGIMSELTHVFLATGLTQTGNNEQIEDGIDETIIIPFKKVLNMIQTGQLTDGQSISALMMAAIELGLLDI